MMYGTNLDQDLFMDEVLKKDFGKDATHKGRRNSLDMMTSGPVAEQKRKRKYLPQTSSESMEESPQVNSALISISRLDELKKYHPIDESNDESRSSVHSSELSMTSTERKRRNDLRNSNVFLMRVIHGNVPHELLASRITSTDRENLSTLMPALGSRDPQQ